MYTITGEYKAVSDYTGYNFKELEGLKYSDYLLYRRDSWISNMRQTEEGKEFLKTCWRLQQTKADTKAIKDFKERR